MSKQLLRPTNYTMKEIGEILGISKERVNQILISALKKMNREFKKRKIKKEDLYYDR